MTVPPGASGSMSMTLSATKLEQMAYLQVTKMSLVSHGNLILPSLSFLAADDIVILCVFVVP